MIVWNAEKMRRWLLTQFFILIKAFVGTTAAQLLINDFLNGILEELLVICGGKKKKTPA